MTRRMALWAGCLACALQGTIALGSPRPDIMSEPAAQQHGLTRAWFTQMQIDPSRGRVRELILDRGMLFLLSDQSVLEAIDASTGVTRWSAQVGTRGFPCLTLAANRRVVAIVNGSTIYVLNRQNGKLLWQTKLDGAPAAGPALSQQRVYVPLFDGRLVSYRLKEVRDTLVEAAPKDPITPDQQAAHDLARLESLRLEQGPQVPLFTSVPGRPMVQPVVTKETESEENVIWATDKGFLCAGRIDRNEPRALELRYRLQTDAPIVARPSYIPPDANVLPDSGLLIAGSEDGFVYAIRERDGQQMWRFSTGEPIVEDPVVLGHYVFAPNQLGGMYCLDAKTGTQVWWTPEVTRFIAASKERIYASDKIGLLHVLSAKTGSQLDMIPAAYLPIKLTNPDSDRLFLASTTGMVQCLHEPSVAQPLVRRVPAKEIEVSERPKTAGKAAPKEKPAGDETADASKPSTRPSGGGGGGSRAPSAPRLGGSKATGKKGLGEAGGAAGGKKKKAKGGQEGGMPGMMPGAMPGMMPGAMPGVVPGAKPKGKKKQ